MRTRIRRTTGWPKRAAVRRICRFRPSRSTTRSHVRSFVPSFSLRRMETRAGAVGLPSSSTPRRHSSSVSSAGAPLHQDVVLLLVAEPGMGEPQRQVAVVGEQDQPLTAQVQPSHRKQPRRVFHQVQDGGAATCAVPLVGEDARRLVQGDVGELARQANGPTVHFNPVPPGVRLLSQAGHLAVHGHPPLPDQVLADPPGTEPGTGQNLLQSLLRIANRIAYRKSQIAYRKSLIVSQIAISVTPGRRPPVGGPQRRSGSGGPSGFPAGRRGRPANPPGRPPPPAPGPRGPRPWSGRGR
jgi:hypothetical protein